MDYVNDQERLKELEEIYGENAPAVLAFTKLEDLLHQMVTLKEHGTTADPRVVGEQVWMGYEFLSHYLAKIDAEYADEYRVSENFLSLLEIGKAKEAVASRRK
ncbi:MAG: hypothetical protein K2Y39_26515 [Candidatus Obscuribacterales bacterium]|nr:hypothetical protein [Candidatus Obscuribacterales bacterium]